MLKKALVLEKQALETFIQTFSLVPSGYFVLVVTSNGHFVKRF